MGGRVHCFCSKTLSEQAPPLSLFSIALLLATCRGPSLAKRGEQTLWLQGKWTKELVKVKGLVMVRLWSRVVDALIIGTVKKRDELVLRLQSREVEGLVGKVIKLMLVLRLQSREVAGMGGKVIKFVMILVLRLQSRVVEGMVGKVIKLVMMLVLRLQSQE